MGSCLNTNRSEQVLEAVNAYFGETECRTVTIEDVGSVVSASQFELNSISLNETEQEYEEVKYLVFIDNGTETAPTPAADQTLITITIDDLDNESTIASTIKTDIDQYFVTEDIFNPFSIDVDGAIVHIENKFMGLITVENDTMTGATKATLRAGYGGNLGAFAEGGVSLSTTTEVLDVLSDQEGATVLDQILRGSNLSATMSLAEMTDQRFEDLIGKVRGDILEINNKKLVGYGTSKLNQSLFQFSGKLVLHPIRLPLEDRSRDIMIWKSAPSMNSLNFSGSAIQVGEFEFNSYQDKSKNKKVDIGLKGDWTEAL